MSCPKFQPLIALYVESDFAPGQEDMVEPHLAVCESCREFDLKMRESQDALKTLRNEFVEGSVFQEVRTEVLRAVSRRCPPRTWPRYVMAAGVALILLAGWVWSTRPGARLQVRPITAVVAAPILIAKVPMAHPRIRMTRARRPRPRAVPSFTSEPLVVKMITDDPQVVIYWLVDQNGG